MTQKQEKLLERFVRREVRKNLKEEIDPNLLAYLSRLLYSEFANRVDDFDRMALAKDCAQMLLERLEINRK